MLTKIHLPNRIGSFERKAAGDTKIVPSINGSLDVYELESIRNIGDDIDGERLASRIHERIYHLSIPRHIIGVVKSR